MPEVAAKSGADFIKGDGTGCRIREDGKVQLAQRNQIPNSDLKDFSGNSVTPDHVTIYRPDRPVGWGVYIRSLSSSSNKTTRQNIRMLDLGKDDYYQTGPLISGPPPPDPTQRANIPPPTTVYASAQSDGTVGLVSGWSAWAYGWIVGRRDRNPSCEVMDSPLLTAPSPRTNLNLASGQCVRLTLPETAPQGAIGIYIAGVVGQSSSGNATSAKMRILRRIDITRGLDRDYLVDRFTSIADCPTSNNTYCGPPATLPAPIREYYHKPGARGLKSFTTKLSYIFKTDHGWSEPQGITGNINTSSMSGKPVRLAFIPQNLPKQAQLWEPRFLGKDGHTWWAMDARNPSRWARMRSNIPEDFPDDVEPSRVRECRHERDPEIPDRTGLPTPGTPFPGAAVEGLPELDPGTYRVHVVFFDEDGRETALSPHKDVSVPLGSRLRVERPMYGNWIPNSTGYTQDRSTGHPRGWTLTTANATNLRVDPPLYFEKTSGATNVTVATLPMTPIYQTAAQGTQNTTIRVLWRFTRYVSGHARPGIRFFDANGTEIGSETAFPTNAGALGDVDMTYSIAKSGVGAQITIPSNATHFRLTIRAHGSVSATNYDVKVLAIGAFPGHVAPRTLPDGFVDDRTVPAVEGDTEQYAHGSYAVIVENPVDRPSALNSFNINSFQYFAPYGTPVHSRNGIRGFLHPVRGGETRTASVYARWEGVSVFSSNAMPIVTLDDTGRTLQSHGGLLNINSITSTWARRTKTYTTHPDAAYVYFPIGNLSDGEVLLAGFQDEDGSTANTYSNTGVAAGSWAITLDTGVPGVEPGSTQEWLNVIHRIEDAGAIYTDDTDDDANGATSVSVDFRSSPTKDPFLWSSWYTDFTDVPRSRYWQIRVTLSTSDLTRSPIVDYMGVRFIRPYGVLLRMDGSEYEGGCVVQSMPPIRTRRKRQEFITDSNDWVLSFSGNWRQSIDGIRLLCFSRTTAEELMSDQDSGDPLLLESYPKRQRALFWPDNIEFEEVEGGYVWDEEAPEYHWHDHEADGVGGHVSDVQEIASQ